VLHAGSLDGLHDRSAPPSSGAAAGTLQDEDPQQDQKQNYGRRGEDSQLDESLPDFLVFKVHLFGIVRHPTVHSLRPQQ
jgi:hypothetical protein